MYISSELMKRREFIKLSSLASIPLIANSCTGKISDGKENYKIKVESLHTIGHKLTSGFDFSKYPSQELTTDYLIVGGGVSGFASLCKLKEKDAILIEASSKPGGTSSYATYKDIIFSLGAHYDVEYPNFFGNEVLELLQELNIIEFNDILDKWDFVEKEYMISPEKESITYFENEIVEDPLNITKKEKDFAALMQKFYTKMILPTRLIDEEFHYLNEITFKEFLAAENMMEDRLIESLNYQLIDDYGEGIDVVNALAGIHYFACRPYFSENPKIFSPPEGNYYFVRKMLVHCHDKQVMTNSFLYKVEESEEGFLSYVWDEEQKLIKKISSKKIIYSGKKHALKFIYPKLQFDHEVSYAPWLVMNFIFPDSGFSLGTKHWQNDVIGENGFMGFVDSRAQFDVKAENRTLTAYYCFKKEERKYLLDVFKSPEELVKNTIELIEKYKGIKLKRVKEVHIKLMGHAMAIPEKNYLFKDINNSSSNPDFIFTGVDNHRLPLMLDAMDAGLNFKLD
jgi:hypothetical protein